MGAGRYGVSDGFLSRWALVLALLVGCVLVGALPARAERAVRKNLITNGGFEDRLAGWKAAAEQTLITKPEAARSGKACLSGEVTEPKQAHMLHRKVPVRADNLYEFEIWARATNGTKLVLWITEPRAEKRRMVTAWTKVTDKWQRFSAPLSFRRDGDLELHIVAPSSHGAPAGRMWIDDIALYETPMPALTAVSEDIGFNDEPSMARSDDGTLYVAWNSFRDGADSLQIARYDARGEDRKRLGAWQAIGGEGTYLLGPRVVAAGDRVFVIYAAERDGKWNIFAARCGPDGPSKPIAVTDGASVDVKPDAAWRNGTLWIAWESNRNGSRQVFAASMQDGKMSPPEPVSPAGHSGYAPSIAVLGGGEVCVAWHSFREHNYDVFLRRRQPDGTWGTERRLTQAPSIDRHPLLVARKDELWLVYENAQTKEYLVTRTNQRRLIVARVTPKGLEAPVSQGKSPLEGRCEAPSAAFDEAGRLWLAFLKPRLPRAGWDVFFTGYRTGAEPGWETPARVSVQKGMDRPPSLAIDENRAVLAFQSDDIPNTWSDVDKTPDAFSDIYLAAVDLGDAPERSEIRCEPLVEPEDVFEAGTLRVERGEDDPTPTIEYQGKTLKLFFGDLHEHTDVSVCNRVGDQSIDESYQHMRDIAGLDFACATDHGYNINPYLWAYTAKLARLNEDRGRFLTFLAEEWTSSFEKYDEKHPFGYHGHRNLIFADPYFPRWWNARNGQTPADVWADLRRMNANFVQIPHQLADTGNVPTDWEYTDETAQPVAEIFQVRGSYEYKGAPREARSTTPESGYFLQDAWARGIVIGVIASPDHGGGMGKACVYAPELSREAILDAIRARHCFGTSAARIFLDVRVNGHLMGEKIPAANGKPVEVKIHVECPADIDRVELCRNNKFIYSNRPEGRTADLTFVDRDPLADPSYYYVRVIQKDEEIAWSSPVWLGVE